MEKLRYEKPFAEIVEFDTSDIVVVASGDTSDNTGDDKKYWCVFLMGEGQGNSCTTVWGLNIGVTSL